MNPFKKEKNYDLEYFTIYDSKTEMYNIPNPAMNQHDLVRQLVNMFKDPRQSDNTFITNAEDFSVFRVGYYSKKSGKLEGCIPEHIINLHEIRAMVQSEASPGALVST